MDVKEEAGAVDIGQKARSLREQRGWTLAQASEASGISVSHLSAIEKGNRPNPSFALVVKLSNAYGVPLTYFADAALPEVLVDNAELASETPALYYEIARRLVEEDALDNPPKLLEILAQYLRDRNANYESKSDS